MSYTPPNGDQVGGNITTGYTPPSGDQVGGDVLIPTTPTLAPSGWASSTFGSPVVTVTASFTPTGWVSSAFGSPSVINFHHFVTGTGWASSSFGTPVIYNLLQFVGASGFHQTVYGTPTIFNLMQFVYPSGIAPPSGQVPNPTQVFDPTQFIEVGTGISSSAIPTTHYVADYYQFIDINGFGTTSHAVSTPFIDFRVRTISVPFIVSTYYGTPTVDNNDIRPSGWTSSVVGDGAVVELGTRFLGQHSAMVFSEYGTPDVQLYRRYVGANSINSLEFGAHTVYNLKQLVEAGPFFTNSPPGEFGTTWFRNRNVTLFANSFVSSRFGHYTSTYVTNAARPLLPPSIDSTLWGSTDVSHRVRTIPLDGIDSFVSRHWHVVYNNARVIAPLSISESALGRPSDVRNLNRTVAQWSVGDTNVFGAAFVARAVRTLTQFNSYPHLTGYFGVPGIRFAVRPIFPPSVVPEYPLGVPRPDGLFGPVTVNGPFIPTIRPNMAIPTERYGTLEIRNRNRTIRPPAVTTRDEFGPFTTVENFVRHIPPAGWQSSAFGEHTVSDRTQRAYPATLTIPTFPASHWVRNLSPDPPSLQYLTVGQWDGLLPFPVPSVRFPTFYPSGWGSSAFGLPTARSNQINIDRGISNLDQVGVPWARGPQYLNFDGDGFKDSAEPPKVRVTPHTIYAPFGDRATGQARANHPTADTPQVIGPESMSLYHVVTNRNRTIYPVGVVRTGYGDATLALRFQYVYPIQIKSLRMGLPVLFGVTQYLNLDTAASGIAPIGFGTTVLTRPVPEPQVVLVSGFTLTTVGTPTIENFIREVLPEGITHRGNPQQGFTNPWGLPMVGYPRVMVMTGFRDSVFGLLSRVEHRIRHVYPEGFDSCSFNEEDIITFSSRMRVKGRRIVVPLSIPSQEVIPQPVVTQ